MSSISVNVFSEVNYWAVLVLGVAAFFLGGLWYSPALFEDVWMRLNGYGKADVEQIQSALGIVGFLMTFLSYVLVAFIFALLVTALGIDRVWVGLILALLIWLGFIATTSLTVNLFSLKPLGAWAIDAIFQLIVLLINGFVLSLWR